MLRSALFIALAILVSMPLAAQTSLEGVLAVPTGAPNGGDAISLMNPDASAPNRVGVTVNSFHSMKSRADTLGSRVRGTSGFDRFYHQSFNPALSAEGRVAFVADWFGSTFSEYQVMAVDRDGRNLTVLTDLIAATANSGFLPIRPEISPDGETVLYTVVHESNTGTPDALFVVPSDGSAEPTAFPFAPLSACDQGAARAAYSPDGTQIAYLGWMDVVDGNATICKPALRVTDADGTNDRVVHGPLDRVAAMVWVRDEVALDWKADRILFSWPTQRPSGGPLARQISVVDVGSGEIAHEVPVLDFVNYDSYQLSPDGLAVGFLERGQFGGSWWVEVRRLADDAVLLDMEGIYEHGNHSFFDWADAAPVPTPDRLEFRQDVLLWHGREVDLAPRVLDPDGNVISYVVDSWSYERGSASITVPSMNHFTNRIWAVETGPNVAGNAFGNSLCAQAAGLETCRTHNVVNTPVFDMEVLDDDIAEKGRNPGRVRVYRYGPPNEVATPQLSTSRAAKHYLDYTLSTLPGVFRWAASSSLADTLQSIDVTVTPIDDAVDEPEIEEGQIRLTCNIHPSGTNTNCASAPAGAIPGVTNGLAEAGNMWRFQIQSNGAGSGLALSSSTPSVIPASGQATLTINGQGMAEGATATLSGPSTVDAEHVSVRQGGVHALARFVLDEAPPGTYDLSITSGGETATLVGAVTVDASIPGGTTNVWAVLQSRSSRRGLALTQYVHYGNDGTADAALTPLLIAVPEGFEPEFKGGLFKFPVPEGYESDASPWLEQTIRAEDIPSVCDRSTVQGGINCDLLTGLGTDVGYKVAVVFLPTIPPGGRGTLAIDMTRQPGARTMPWFVKVGAPFNTLEFDEGESPAGVIASIFEDSGPRVVQPVNVNACASSTMARSSQDESSGKARAAACAGCLNLVLTAIVESSSYGKCAKASIAAAQSAYQTFIDVSAGGSDVTLAADGLSTLTNVTLAIAQCAFAANPVASGLSALYSAMGALSGLSACADCFGISYIDIIGKVITADPNDKIGPTGIGEGLHVAEFGRMGYTIRYENLPTATASVVELVITDTLDTSVYDLSTFQVGPITVPDTTFTPPPGLRAWTTFWDRRPAVNSIVRVNVDLDDQTGIVTWTLSDLDPVTFELLTTAEAGFIPPNDDNGAGEGSVQFMIRTLDGLPDGTVVANGATIRFDRNELISTPLWGNTLDLGLPSSRASSITPLEGDTTYVVRMTGADTGSGVHGYDLYAQAPNGPFLYAGSTRSDSLIFEGEAGVTYGLFALATDRVGNAENVKFSAEIFTDGTVDAAEESASSLPTELTLAPPYPNPSSGPVVFQVGLPASGVVDLRVFDVRGREVARVLDDELAAGWHVAPWDASALPAGVYVVRARTPSGVVSSRLTVVR